MDNLNNGFTNPNAPSNSTTQSSFGGVNPVQQYNQTSSVNDVATQNPLMDPMSTPQTPVVNPPMDNATQPVTDEAYKQDLDALKALSDELNSVQSTTASPVVPVDNTIAPLGSSDIEVGTPMPSMGTSDMGVPSFDTPVVEPTPVTNDLPSFGGSMDTPNLPDTPVVESTPVDSAIPSFGSDMGTPAVADIPVSQPSTEMDVNALSADPWATPSPIVEETPMPMQDVVPSVDSNTMANDLDALNSTSMPSETPVMGGMGSTMETPVIPSVIEEESAPVDSAPAFANMPSDLSQPLSSVQGELAPVEEQKEEVVNEDIVNTLPPKEEGKEGNILIIVLVVLIVALIAAIGYFAYQIFLS